MNLTPFSRKWPAAFVGAAYPHMLDLAVYEGMGAPGKEYEPILAIRDSELLFSN
jgi:hypothetical protein